MKTTLSVPLKDMCKLCFNQPSDAFTPEGAVDKNYIITLQTTKQRLSIGIAALLLTTCMYI